MVLKWSRSIITKARSSRSAVIGPVGQAVVAAVQQGHFLLDVLGQEAAVGEPGQGVGDAGPRQLVVGLLQVDLALRTARASAPARGTPARARTPPRASNLRFWDARHARPPRPGTQRVAGVGPRRGPRRSRHVHRHGQALLVPAAVAVGAAQAEGVVAGVEVRVGDAALAAERHPLGVEALELVREQVAVGRGEVEGRELEAQHLVAEARAGCSASRRRGRPAADGRR